MMQLVKYIKFCRNNCTYNRFAYVYGLQKGLPAFSMGQSSVFSLMFIFSFPQQLSILCHVVCVSKEKIIC